VTPLLKWVKPEAEEELRAAFAQTLKVRALGAEAQELADRYFFETLVRVHRAGEGAPYTGLKPAGQIVPVVAKADQALAQGNIDALVKAILEHTEEGIRERFAHALETAKQADESVAAGREYVEAYVSYVHYLEGIAQVVHGALHHAEAAAAAVHNH
jgi:UDP-2,3-diacylglucosamine pyrophosphatase LpxH